MPYVARAVLVVLIAGLLACQTAAPAPPLEPPDVRCVSQGLVVTPSNGESVTAFQPNSGVAVLPSVTVPAACRRSTAGAS